ncbi:hypothetical protein [Pandoraea sputorum]|uniref:hypothetical protein n=1 Tax=Pandoraea sputorum TaxID=93222 RepID=UPI00123F93E5|nr:hypothetical protein [Pandoraea sputorum]
MRTSLRFRVHEWLADRVSWVQYPNIRAVSPNAKRAPILRFSVQMPWSTRVMLVATCLPVLIVCAVFLAVALPIFGAVASAVFGF